MYKLIISQCIDTILNYMAIQDKNRKLDRLLSEWVPKTVYTSSYLEKLGYGADLLNGYKETGWIRSIGRGAYVRFKEEPSWEGGVYALRQQLELPVHIGGITALTLLGRAHFIPSRLSQCHLYLSRKHKLPKWFMSFDWEVDMILHISSFLREEDIGLTQIRRELIPVTLSSPERAILEMLSHVNSESSFTHAWRIMEGLTTLRPDLMQELIERCNSIKIVRLCLYMAEKNQLPWFERLDTTKFNFGSGKRSIVKGGKLNKNYQITVPVNLEDDSWI